MAEKGILVEDAKAGESVACRDASVVDDDGNARVIQLVDGASRKNNISMASPLRSAVTSTDSYDLSTIPSGILDNAITIGDATSICVTVTFVDNGSDHGIYVTPILIEETNDVAIALLEPKKFCAVTEEWEDGYASQFEIGSGVALTIAQVWNVCGAYRVGFHINTDGDSVNLYACPCSDPASGFSGIASAAKEGFYGLSDMVS